uniref:Putative synapse-associated protein n=1 Tax=Triatoma infestans TaxID=30076 RepID=A0A023F2E9_TRIIF
MFSGITNQVSSWMGKKQEVESDKTEDTSAIEDSPVAPASDDVIADGNKKDTSPTKTSAGSARLEILGNIGGSVRTQMSSWLGGGIPGLRKTDSGAAGSGNEYSAAATVASPPTPQLSNRGSPVDKEDEASSDTGGADSEGHASEGSGSPLEEKDPTQIAVVSTKVAAGAKSFGSFLYSAVNKAGAKVSEASAKIKKTVEENSLLGEFNKEQEAFIKEKAEKSAVGAASVPPWLGCPNQQALKQECLALSQDRRNFVRAPPEGVDFTFEYETQFAVCEAILAEDPNLEKMRFELVPKVINEENFWRNYMYRVSLICQANELSSMVQENSNVADRTSQSAGAEITATACKETENDSLRREVEWTNSPMPNSRSSGGGGDEEFVSDTFTARPEDYAEVREGIRRLGLGDKKNLPEEDWERELDAELQDFEMIVGSTGLSQHNVPIPALDEHLLDDLTDLK